MNFDMVTPCSHCPFRTDRPGFLRRAAEIAEGLRGGATFSCHKTNEFDENEDGEGDAIETEDSQHCAGALIVLEKEEWPSQLMRIAERLGWYDRRKLRMDAPVFDSLDEFEEHHETEAAS